MLEDGIYDVMVVDATDGPEAIQVELTVLSGPHKGEMITVNAVGLQRDPLDLLAVPGTVRVLGGKPHLSLEG